MSATQDNRIGQLIGNHDRWRLILGTLAEGVAIWDPDGQLRYANPAAQALCPGFDFTSTASMLTELLSVLRDPADEALAITDLSATALFEKLCATNSILARTKAEPSRWLQLSCKLLPIIEESANGMITSFVDVTELQHHNEAMARIANFDPVTGLPNRNLLSDRLAITLARARRSGRKAAICLLDLDGFKLVNDRMGHAAGDELLKHVARRLQVEVRSEDTVARLGGDEFVLIVGDLSSQAEVEPILKRILHYLAESYQLRGKTLAGITCSIGVTMYPDDDANPDTLLRHADHAMYEAKRAGKANYSWFNSESEQRQTARKQAEMELSQALSKKQLVLHYQPIINAQAGRVVSAEALIRWQHPILGCLPPAHFLPLIQDRELSVAIGSFVIEQALKDSCRWRNDGLDIDVHVNLDVCQLQQEDFLRYIQGLLKAHGCDGAKLILELVEDAALEGVADLSSVVSACEAIGVSFAIDDFGTGYSSLNHLRQIPAGALKIDRSFVSGMLTDSENRTLIEAIIGLGKAFDRTIIAEGVEQFTQATALLDAGCELMQGFYFAKPMPADTVPAWTQRFESSSKSQITNESGYRNNVTTRAGV